MINNIKAGGLYRTRGGQKVRIYATDARGPFPVHGAYSHGDNWVSGVWTGGGSFLIDTASNERDLVAEWREPVTVDGWVNVYSNYKTIYFTKKEADAGASSTRLACVHVTGKEGET